MKDATVRERAIQAVVDSLPPNSAKDPKIIDDFPLRSGHVFEVLFDPETGLSKYAHYGHGEFRVFSRSRELIQFIVRSERQHNAAIHLLQVAGIPAALRGLRSHFARIMGHCENDVLLVAGIQRSPQRFTVHRHPFLGALGMDAQAETAFDEAVQRRPIQACQQAGQVSARNGFGLLDLDHFAEPNHAVADKTVDRGKALTSHQCGQYKRSGHPG